MRKTQLYPALLISALLLLLSPLVGWGQTCNSAIPESTPISAFPDTGNGTVTDTRTGLVWKLCVEGQTWDVDSFTCSGNAQIYTWQQALLRAKAHNDAGGFAGQTDWRLPNVKELLSITEERCYDPAINLSVFPETNSSDFWSASAYADASGYAWHVLFSHGYAYYGYEDGSFQVRLARAGQSFGPLAFAGSVSKAGTGTGTVTSNPAGINCGGDCMGSYSSGTNVTLTATPDSGSTFVGWSGGGCSGAGNCVVTMNAAQTITATFTRVTYSLTVNKSGAGGGTVTSSPAGINCGAGCATSVRSYNGGSRVTLTASAASGSTFSGWSGSGCSGTGACTVTLSAARTVTASFKANQTIGTITFAPATLAVGGTTTASATATSGLTVAFSSITPSVCTVSGRTVTGTSAGTCTIAANQAGSANYNPAPRVTRNLTVTTPSPDFVVTGMTLSATSPAANSTFSVNVTVRNQGTAAGDGGQLNVWLNQAEDQNCDAPGDRSAVVGVLAVGASKTLTFTGLPAGGVGSKTLRAFVDSACTIPEFNEINNQYTRTYTVVPPPAPDLVVTAITLTPTSPVVNGTFSARVTVRNQGTATALAGGKLVVWTNQSTAQNCGASGNNSSTLGALLNGVDTMVTFSGLPAGNAGNKALRVFVDNNCAITESNETNNQRTQTYTVR
ncbi:hypothetical protein CCP3SC15_270010 [Gammaproteobacteria bacterium]